MKFNLLVRILSCFILDKRKRKWFRDVCMYVWSSGRLPDNLMRQMVEMSMSTLSLHQQTFTEFKGCCTGRDVVVVASGPSLERFKPIDGAVYIGVNKAFRAKNLKLDYLFAHDFSGLHDAIDGMNEYRRGECVKFYGMVRECDDRWGVLFPESAVIKAAARRYRTKWWKAEDDVLFQERFALDLSRELLATFKSVVFHALQFALWTNPRRIYLVGCDCSGTKHFSANGEMASGRDFSDLVARYAEFRKFAEVNYPETEIVSVNPVGLKGIFTDLYQDA